VIPACDGSFLAISQEAASLAFQWPRKAMGPRNLPANRLRGQLWGQRFSAVLGRSRSGSPQALVSGRFLKIRVSVVRFRP
jgi:hypothetical protein